MNSLYKNMIFFLLFITLAIYSVNSFKYITRWILFNSNLSREYTNLETERNKISKQIDSLNIKVSGLREESINKDILEVQAKSILNMLSSGEIILVE